MNCLIVDFEVSGFGASGGSSALGIAFSRPVEARPQPPLCGAPGEKVPGVFESLEAWGLSFMCLRGRDVRDVS